MVASISGCGHPSYNSSAYVDWWNSHILVWEYCLFVYKKWGVDIFHVFILCISYNRYIQYVTQTAEIERERERGKKRKYYLFFNFLGLPLFLPSWCLFLSCDLQILQMSTEIVCIIVECLESSFSCMIVCLRQQCFPGKSPTDLLLCAFCGIISGNSLSSIITILCLWFTTVASWRQIVNGQNTNWVCKCSTLSFSFSPTSQELLGWWNTKEKLPKQNPLLSCKEDLPEAPGRLQAVPFVGGEPTPACWMLNSRLGPCCRLLPCLRRIFKGEEIDAIPSLLVSGTMEFTMFTTRL